MSGQNKYTEFKQILSELPEDKRKRLYKRLHDLPEKEREAFINDFIRKYKESGKNPPVAKRTPDTNADKNNTEDEVKDSTSEEVTSDEEKTPESKKPSKNESVTKKNTPVKENTVNNKPADTKEKVQKNPYISVAIGLLAAVFIMGILYFIYVFNKQKIDEKFNSMLGLTPTESVSTETEINDIIGPEPKQFPTNTPTPSPTPTPIPLAEDHPDLTGLVIVIDPGHQENPDTELEEVVPGSSIEKEKASSGAVGVNSGIKEYELTLEYSLMVKDYLEACGAEVIITRTENDVDLSNIDRANIAIENEADYFIRIHADSAPDSEISGVKVYVPSTGSYSSGAASEGTRLAESVAEAIGSTSLGAVQSNMYTGLNHADSIPSYQLVVGYLSNSDDEALLCNEDTAYNLAVGISNFLAQ